MYFEIEPLECRRLLSAIVTPSIVYAPQPPAGDSLPGQLNARTIGGAFAEDQDIGSPAQAGSSSYANGVYTLTGGGTDIGGNSDQFHFTSNHWNADGTIIANVTSLANTDGAAKAGLMFRNGVSATAAFAGIFVTASNGINLITRATDGSTAGQTTAFGFHAPRFLKLTRAGNQVTAYHSADGITWIQLGSPQSVSLGAETRVGLAVTSHNVATTTTAAFANVSLLLPSGWSANDIASGSLPGSTVYDPAVNQFQVQGSGLDIGGTSDRFHFASRSMTGNGAVIARVDALADGGPSAKAGVMLRNDLGSGAIFVSVVRTAQNGLLFQWRSATGATASTFAGPSVSGPVWLKLAQQGNSFSAYYSGSSGNWTQIGTSQIIAMSSATAFAGLAVTSGNTASLASATFSSASIVQDGWSDIDIGAPRLSGSATYDAASNTYTLTGSGASITRTATDPLLRMITPDAPRLPDRRVIADQLNFASRTMNGDGSVVAFVNTLSNTDPWARAGVMIRAAAGTSGSPYAALFITSRNGVVFEWRTTSGGQVRRFTLVPATGSAAAPAGLKLTRFANNFAAYYSADGINWTLVGAIQSISMPAVTAAGIAVTAQNNAALCTATFTGVSVGREIPPGAGIYSAADELFLNDLEQRSVQFYWAETNPNTGLVPDGANANGGSPSGASSIAAIGFGLSALTIGDQRGWITHANAYQRALNTVNFLYNNAAQVNGFFYHFLDPVTGARSGGSELSSVDTAELMAGVLNVAQHWAGTPLQTVATNLFNRVNWPWMQKPNGQFYGQWTPERGFEYGYGDFSEAVVLYLLGLGSPTHPTATSSWTSWSRSPVIHYAGYTFVTAQTGALFTVQYPQAWFDLRGLTDSTGLNYYVNSQTATLAQRQMCIDLRGTFPDYGPNLWGLTASDSATGYTVWGGPPPTPNINGTVVPTAPGGSLEFVPRRAVDALRYMQQTYGGTVYRKYGFVDAFNPLTNWTSSIVLGIDVGMMLLSAENSRSNFVWDEFMQSPAAQQSLTRAFASTSPSQVGGIWPDGAIAPTRRAAAMSAAVTYAPSAAKMTANAISTATMTTTWTVQRTLDLVDELITQEKGPTAL